MSYRSSLTALWLIAAAMCLSSLAGCSTLSVGSDYDRDASFAGFHTFTVMQREHHDVRQYREGTLSIDVFDARTHRPVWHGWAKKELNRSDIQNSEEPIRKAVAAVLAKFPPGGA